MITTAARCYDYSKTRFPLGPLLLHCGLTAFVIGAVSNGSSWDSLIYAVMYLLFLLHMRVLDEYKDKDFDDKNYPGRPVQSGSITLEELRGIGIFNFFILLLLGFIKLNGASWVLFLTAIGYSFLMYKEFFIKDFWQRSPSLYLFFHQVVLILLFLVFMLSGFDYERMSLMGANLAFVYAAVLIIELGRKIKRRYDPEGNETLDTYAYVWGQRFTINAVVLIGIAVFMLNAWIGNMSLVGAWAGLSLYGVYFVLSYAKKQSFIDNAREYSFILTLLHLSIYLVAQT